MSCSYSLVRVTLWGLSVVIAGLAQADRDLRQNYLDSRWAGRGNTGVASVSDASALFYNPSGLAFNRFVRLSMLNPSLSANQNVLTTAETLQDVKDSNESISEKFSPFLGKPMDLRVNVFPSISMPFFSAGVYSSALTAVEYRNPVDPRLDFAYRNDFGLVGGGAIQPIKNLAVGMSLRYVKRSSVEDTISGGLLLGSLEDLATNLQRSGEAFALNVGTQYRMLLSDWQYLSFGLAVEDFGQTQYRNRTGSKPAPRSQGQMINLGLNYGLETALVDFQVMGDYRGFNNDQITKSKKVFMGAELSILKFDLRGGIAQGYWTAGVSMRLLPFLDFDLSSYGEELGYSAGQKENRVWVFALRSGLEINTKSNKPSARRQKFSLDDIK